MERVHARRRDGAALCEELPEPPPAETQIEGPVDRARLGVRLEPSRRLGRLVLFTDLVSSTELLQRVGDEQAQRVLRAHHRLLKEALAVHGGREEKWLGDGVMTVFASAADAVRCAVTMQQTARRRAAGERLGLRVGLHVGEALREESDWFGTPVVVARRLCDRAAAGQILCSGLVVELLNGRRSRKLPRVLGSPCRLDVHL
jgi:class 3 adenylate cyclase